MRSLAQPLSAQLVRPGGYFFVLGKSRRISDHHYGIRCEACEYTVTVPTRFGRAHAECLRRLHLFSAHGTDLAAGRITIEPNQ